MTDNAGALAYARRNHERYLKELSDFISIPSVSTLSEHKPDMQRAAEWVAAQLRTLGFSNVAVMPTAGHPVAYGEWLGAPGKPTVLIYGHYDVQPADPLDEWVTPPFEATRKGDELYARGASDMKGNDHAFLKALEAIQKNGGLPINVKILVEGEEEIGSLHLGAFIDQHRDLLKCDFALNADSGILKPDLPAIVYGLRGLAYFEIRVYGPKQDLHSGIFGGSVHNPAQALCELIAGMHDEHGHITLPGFYDKVRVLSPEERAELAQTPHDDSEWQQMAGVARLHGEDEFTTVERTGTRPTLEVNGLLSGFTGEGAKTVLPAKAMAKISMRLVPYQDEEEVERQLRQYLTEHAPPTIRWEVSHLSSGAAVLLERDSPAARAARRALEETFGIAPIYITSGGSVPIVGMMKKKLGVDSVLLGFGLPDDNLHSPNEKLHLPNYFRGIETYIRFFDAVGSSN